MQEPVAFLNGRWIPASAAAVPVTDAGFVQGTTVAEQLRTFGGTLFHLDDHLARLAHSLEIIGVAPGMTLQQFAATARELIAHNHALLSPGDDLGLSIFVTPGTYPAYASGDADENKLGAVPIFAGTAAQPWSTKMGLSPLAISSAWRDACLTVWLGSR